MAKKSSIGNDFLVEGNLEVIGILSLGEIGSIGTNRDIQAFGVEDDIDITVIPKGVGTIKAPSGYESKIDADEDLINLGFHRTNIVGKNISSLLEAPTVDENGYVISWDFPNNNFNLVDIGIGTTYQNALNKIGSVVKLGGPLTEDTIITGNFNLLLGTDIDKISSFQVRAVGGFDINGIGNSRLVTSGFHSIQLIGGVVSSYLMVNDDGAIILRDNSGGINKRGLRGYENYSDNITDHDYIQKVYADTKIVGRSISSNLLTPTGAEHFNVIKWDSINQRFTLAVESGTQFFLGYFTSLVNLQLAYPIGEEGNYAFVDEGVGQDTFLYIWDETDDEWVVGGSNGSSGGGHTIQDHGIPLIQRDNLNFVGDGVSVVDDLPNNATVVTINATPDWDDTTKGKVERAIQAEAETAAEVLEANRNNTVGISPRGFRWAFDEVWTWVKTQAQTFAKAKLTHGAFGYTVLTDGATINWNADTIGNIAQITLGGNRTLAAITNPQTGGLYILRVVQDGTGDRTLTFNAAYTFPNGITPVLNSAANAVTVYEFFYDGTNFRYTGVNGALRVTNILANSQIESEKKVGLYIDTDGTIRKVAEAEYNNMLKNWVYTGSDSSFSTTSVRWQNSALELMFELYNDKVAKFGGTSALLEVNEGIESGNATLRFLSYATGAGLGFRFQDNLLNDYINLRSLTTNRGILLRQPVEYNYGVGEIVFTRQFKLTLPNTTASLNHVVFEYTLAEEEHYEIKVEKAESIALNTDGSKSITSSFGTVDTADVRRITAGSIQGNTIVSTQSRLPNTVTSGEFNWIIDVGTNKIQYCFRNGASPDNETYDIFVHISVVKRNTPIDA
jgi:hypothetical protein